MNHQPRNGRHDGPACNERLDGWKEIAAFLKRDVRTVQRWEEREGLPIRRHLHSRRGTVFAFPAELNAWWNSREDSPSEVRGTQSLHHFRRLFPLALLSTFFLLTLAAGWLAMREAPADQTDLSSRNWVLIARFDNRTGEELLDGTLEYALERELSGSRHLNVVPRPRVEDALALMKKHPDTPLDGDLAREVALRDGGIRAVLSGRIERLATAYQLSLQALDPLHGTALAARSEEAADLSQVLTATRRLSSWARKTLGEAPPLIRESEEGLRKVTTPSLKALQLFSHADTALKRPDKQAVGEQLLKATLAEDPEFAAAHTWLAYAIANQGRPQAEYLAHAQRGFELSERVSERERYIIRGSHHLLANRLEEALPFWEALVERHPEDYWGNNNLLIIYGQTNRRDQWVQQILKMGMLRPNNYAWQGRAAMMLAQMVGDPIRARSFVMRARDLTSPRNKASDPYLAARLELFPAWEHWLKGDIEAALRSAGTVEARLRSLEGELRMNVAEQLGYLYFALGRLEKARQTLSGSGSSEWEWALAAFETKPGESVKDAGPMSAADSDSPYAVFGQARNGRLAQAEEAATKLERELLPNPFFSVDRWRRAYWANLLGEMDLAKGRTREAISRFETGLEGFKDGPAPGIYFLAAESLAWIYERQGQFEKAIAVLKRASLQTRERCYPFLRASFWLRNEWLLAQLYRRQGQDQKAAALERELLKLLQCADSDHPILTWLRSTQSPARRSGGRPE